MTCECSNLVVWVKTFEKYRPILLAAGVLGVYGRTQREGDVVHLVAQRLTDPSPYLGSVSDRDAAFPLPHGRGGEFHHGTPRPDPRGLPKEPRPRDIVDPYLHLDVKRG
ncbi:DNA-binding protein (plasmid) [Rhizobium sp. RCAM05350]|nr:DNA-binding protein [Rhizobium sp. RCAM05350]